MKIPINDIKYAIINTKEYKAVKCTGIVNMYGVLLRNFNLHDCDDLSRIAVNHNTKAVFNVQGWSKCSAEDEFDEVIGKRIAESRMLINAYNKINTFLSTVIKNTDDLVGRLEDFKYDLIQKRINVENQHLNKLKNGN